jgi:spermidine synthase
MSLESVLARWPRARSRTDLRLLVLYGLFFASGLSALCIELVFSKYLGFVFGTTAYAISTVLAAFMAGLAIGNVIGGRLSSRLAQPVRVYGVCELIVGVYALLCPIFFGWLSTLVSWIGPSVAHAGEGAAALTLLRFGLSWVVILPPTIMMGVSFPLLSRSLTDFAHLGRTLTRLYTLNTLGAAFGTFLSTYVLIQLLGLFGTLAFAFVVNALVFAGSYWLSVQPRAVAVEAGGGEAALDGGPHTDSGSRGSGVGAVSSEPVAAVEPAAGALPAFAGEPVTPAVNDPKLGRTFWPLYLLAVFSGVITLSFEVVWTHVLALLVGTSTYAFGLVLTIFLLALALGGYTVSRYLSALSASAVQRLLSVLLVLLGSVVIATLPLWENANEVFTFVGLWRPSFIWREVTRGLVVFGLIFVPATLMGVLFPLALALLREAGRDVGRRVGLAVSLNTCATIVGSTLTGFLLIELLGSEWTLRSLGIASVLPAFALLGGWRSLFGRALVAAAAVLVILSALKKDAWDMAVLGNGANIYFAPSYDIYQHRLTWLREDVHGGFTSVVTDGDVHTIMTNGKFEGNDGPERVDQVLVAVVPNLYVKHRRRAVNIGLGTGQTLSVIEKFGYKEIEAVDISPNIVAAADGTFSSINGGVFRKPNIELRYRDGRNHLLLNTKPYDLIAVELSSVWFASAGNLYSHEFYELCRANLQPDGVLQQWIQLHHITLDDVAMVINTLKQVFPHVEFWVGGHQGILVASRAPLERQINRFRDLPAPIRGILGTVHVDEMHEILEHLLIPADAMDRVLTRITRDPERISTDNNLLLEYSTPRANELDEVFESNIAELRAAVGG